MASPVPRWSRGHLRLLATLVVGVSTLLLMLSLMLNQSDSAAVLLVDSLRNDVKDPASVGRGDEAFEQMLLKVVAEPVVVVTAAPPPLTQSGPSTTFKPGSPKAFIADLHFTLNEPDVCTKLRPDVFTLIYVHTAPSHFKHRAVIRRTFGSTTLYGKLKTVTLFFVGKSEDAALESAIRLESDRYHDIIQGDFLDSYRNLSLKALSALHWIVDYCPRAPYLLKVDDDMFVNVFNLVRHLNFLIKYGVGQNSIHCLVWNGMHVLREKNSKWYVSPEEFTNDTYPPYCSGSAFFMTAAIPPRLYEASKRAPFLWVDDAYATGILAKEADVHHHSINSIVVFKNEDYEQKLIRGEAVFGHMTGDAGLNLRHQYWTMVLQQEEAAAS